MGSRRTRILTLVSLFGLVLTAALTGADPADAAITGSSIASPANGSELFYDGDSLSGAITVSGTVSSPSPGARGDLLCYSISNTSSIRLYTNIDVSSGSFGVSVSLAPIAGRACRLAVVPAGTTPTGSAATEFAGPAISVSDRFSESTDGSLWGYYILSGTLPFSFALQSLGECPVSASYATDPATLGSFQLFAGGACLPRRSGIGVANGTRSAILVDGANAYAPGAISNLTSDGGFEPLTYSASFDAAHDSVTITEEDAVMICGAPGGFPPAASNCPSLHSSGVVVDQSTQLFGSGQVVRVGDRFRSVDGHSHVLDLLFGQTVGDASGGAVPGFAFPGQSSIATHAIPDSFTSFPAGPGSIVVDRDASATPSTSNPTGGITYGRAPQSADFVSSSGSSVATFLMHYGDTVPAGGAVTYDFSFAQSASASQLASLDAVERDRFAAPGLSISHPRRHKVVSHTFAPLLTGRVSDAVGIYSLTVAGKRVPVGAGGVFVTRLDLRHRRNVVKVIVTNLAGIATSRQLVVIYKPRACVVPRVRRLVLQHAEGKLLARDCSVAVRYVRSRRVAKGHVVRVQPGPGGAHRARKRVTLFVSRGP